MQPAHPHRPNRTKYAICLPTHDQHYSSTLHLSSPSQNLFPDHLQIHPTHNIPQPPPNNPSPANLLQSLHGSPLLLPLLKLPPDNLLALCPRRPAMARIRLLGEGRGRPFPWGIVRGFAVVSTVGTAGFCGCDGAVWLDRVLELEAGWRMERRGVGGCELVGRDGCVGGGSDAFLGAGRIV